MPKQPFPADGEAVPEADHDETRFERIRRLSRELSDALADWIENDMGGEKWAVRIYPPALDRHSIYLQNLNAYETPEWDMAIPTNKGV